MEFNHRIGISVFLLALLLAPPPCIAVRGLRKEVPEVYEIDYRGPETHSYLPPPDGSAAGSGGHRHHLRRQKHKANDLRFAKNGRKEKAIHG